MNHTRPDNNPRMEPPVAFRLHWNRWTDPEGTPLPLPRNWDRSVLTFLDEGLDMDDLTSAIDTTMNRDGVSDSDRFKYMCGVCWNWIRAGAGQ